MELCKIRATEKVLLYQLELCSCFCLLFFFLWAKLRLKVFIFYSERKKREGAHTAHSVSKMRGCSTSLLQHSFGLANVCQMCSTGWTREEPKLPLMATAGTTRGSEEISIVHSNSCMLGKISWNGCWDCDLSALFSLFSLVLFSCLRLQLGFLFGSFPSSHLRAVVSLRHDLTSLVVCWGCLSSLTQ